MTRSFACLLAIALAACGSDDPDDAAETTGTPASTSGVDETTDSRPPNPSDPGSLDAGSETTTGDGDTSTGATETGSTSVASSSETGSTSDSGSDSGTEGVTPTPYGPCGTCLPDEIELDLGGSCSCAPMCDASDDCPDPGTGADPFCATDAGGCLLFCRTDEQCPAGSICPDPRRLPDGAQGYCYYP